MPLNVRINDHFSALTKITFPEAGSHFTAVNEDESTFIEITYPLRASFEFDRNKFSLHFLAKANLLENDIFQVFNQETGSRIGWCFPIQALASREHSYADNDYFLNYAFVAALKIFEYEFEGTYVKHPEYVNNATYTISDFFAPNTAILLISLDTLNGEPFDIHQWLPSLSQYGYFYLSKRDPQAIKLKCERPAGNKITIFPYTVDAIDTSFIDKVL